MVKIIKMEPVADMDGNLEDIVSYLNQVKNALADLIDQYDENPELEDKAYGGLGCFRGRIRYY
jgi:hypothetical protein